MADQAPLSPLRKTNGPCQPKLLLRCELSWKNDEAQIRTHPTVFSFEHWGFVRHCHSDFVIGKGSLR
jgi:hypothetical protein